MASTVSEYAGWATDGPGVFIEPETAPYGETGGRFGGSLNQHLARRALSVTPEVPLWRTSSPSPPPQGARQGLVQVADELDASARVLEDILASAAPGFTLRTPFEPAATAHLAACRGLAARARSWSGEPGPDEYASEARTLHALRLRSAGLMLRALAAETAAGNQSAAIRAAASGLNLQFTKWLAALESALQPRAVPIESLVQVQVSAAMAAADYLLHEDA